MDLRCEAMTYQGDNLDHGGPEVTLSQGCHNAPFVVLLKPINAAPSCCAGANSGGLPHMYTHTWGQLTSQACILDRGKKKDN